MRNLCSWTGTVRSLLILALITTIVAPISAENLTVTLEAGDYSITTTADGRQTINMEGFSSLLVSGKPALAAKVFMIALPPGAEVTGVNTTVNNPVDIADTYRIMAAPPHLPSRFNQQLVDERQKRWQENYDQTYGSDQPWPEAQGTYLGDGALRQYRFVRVAYCPFSYRPLSGKLAYFPSMTVSIDYQLPATPVAVYADTVAEKRATELFVNYDDAQDWYQPTMSPAEVNDYVIITDVGLRESLQPLVEWKESLGYSVNVTTINYIESSYAGFDRVERIRNFLKDVYEEWGVQYVLLAGGLDIIPMRQCFPDPTNHNSGSEYCPPTDYYYADLTSNWDSDGDGYYGELNDDAVDFVPEVIVGRLPFSTEGELEALCTKLVAFESDKGTWKKNALLVGAMSNYPNQYNGLPGTDGAELMELMIADMSAEWSNTKLYEKEGVQPSTYACDLPLTRTNVLNTLLSQSFGVINWWAHGSSDAAWRFWWDHDDGDGMPESSELYWEDFLNMYDGAYLDDSHPSVVFSCSCNNGWLEYSDNMTTSLLQDGSAGIVSSTRVSWFIEGWGTINWGGNASIDQHFFRYLINEEQPFGDALFSSKVYYYNNYFWGGYDYDWSPQQNMFDFCAFGDPSQVFLGTEPGCCGRYTGGYTGNTNCDESGSMSLQDVTRLIDRIYLSQTALCCEENGNVNGDTEGLINLQDITALIDHIYLSRNPTAKCQ